MTATAIILLLLLALDSTGLSASTNGFDIHNISGICASSLNSILGAANTANSDPLQQMVMSSGRFPGDPGNYLQCNINQVTRLCMVRSSDLLLLPNTSYALFNTSVETGLCVPNGCNDDDVVSMATQFYFPILMHQNISSTDIASVDCLESTHVHSTGAILSLFLLCLLMLLSVIGTAFKYWTPLPRSSYLNHPTQPASVFEQRYAILASSAKPEPETTETSFTSDVKTPLLSSSSHTAPRVATRAATSTLTHQLLCSFDVVDNFKSIFKTPAQNNGMKALDGLRVLSIVC